MAGPALHDPTPPVVAHGARVPAPPLARGWKAAPPLFCPCGTAEPATVAGLCRSCYNRYDHNQRAFGGLRYAALVRDHFRCRVCPPPAAPPRYLAVHHRTPGVNELDRFVTLCAACHGVVTHLQQPDAWLPPFLLLLWREQHPEAPDQGQFTFDGWTPPPASSSRDPRVVAVVDEARPPVEPHPLLPLVFEGS